MNCFTVCGICRTGGGPLDRRQLRPCCPSQMRTSVCQPAAIMGPLPEPGLSKLAWRPLSLPEESTHSQLPLLEEPERKVPCVPEV